MVCPHPFSYHPCSHEDPERGLSPRLLGNHSLHILKIFMPYGPSVVLFSLTYLKYLFTPQVFIEHLLGNRYLTALIIPLPLRFLFPSSWLVTPLWYIAFLHVWPLLSASWPSLSPAFHSHQDWSHFSSLSAWISTIAAKSSLENLVLITIVLKIFLRCTALILVKALIVSTGYFYLIMPP